MSEDAKEAVVEKLVTQKLAQEEVQRKMALERDSAFAKARQDEELKRMASPTGVSVQGGSEDPVIAIARIHAEPQGLKVLGRNAPFNLYQNTPEKHRETLQKGYIPLKNVSTGEQVMCGNDLVYYRDRRIRDAAIQRAHLDSQAQLQADDAAMREAERGGAGGLKVQASETVLTKGAAGQ